MTVSTAHVPTASGSRYLQQLCKHWGHKFDVTFDARHGEIPLPFGPLTMDATPDELVLVLKTNDPGSLDRFEGVVAEHVQRFAFREQLVFNWSRAEDTVPAAS